MTLEEAFVPLGQEFSARVKMYLGSSSSARAGLYLLSKMYFSASGALTA